MDDYLELLELVKKHTTLFHDLTQIQQVKLESAKDQDIARLEDCMKKEQAHTLALRGFDKKREAIQKKLSFEGKTFRELIPLVPETYKDAYQLAFRELTDGYHQYQESSACAKDMIEINIHKTNTIINRIREHADMAGSDAYAPEGRISDLPHSRRDMKV